MSSTPDVQTQIDWLGARLKDVHGRVLSLHAEIKKLTDEAAALEDQYNGLVAWQIDLKKSLVERGSTSIPAGVAAMGPIAEKYRGLSTRRAVEKYGKEHNGILVAQEIKRELLAANFFTNPKNAEQTIFGELSRGYKGGRYRKERPGAYIMVSMLSESRTAPVVTIVNSIGGDPQNRGG